MTLGEILVAALTLSLLALGSDAGLRAGFGQPAQRRLRQPIPSVELTSREQERLYQGDPQIALMPGQSGQNAGRIEAIVPFDPVTAFMVITDLRHYALVDPSYPRSGPPGDKRRTFMPYVVDATVCQESGASYQYQLLNLPLVAPRMYSLRHVEDTSAFPWESAWSSDGVMRCAELRDPAEEQLYAAAVQVVENRGAWRVAPLPPALQRTAGDRLRAHVIYYVDASPGGDLARFTGVVDAATRAAMRGLVDNLTFQGKRWREHLRRYHSADERARYERLVKAYRDAVGVD